MVTRSPDISPDIVIRVADYMSVPLNKRIEYDYQSGSMPVYIGIGNINATEDDDNWVIVKNTYTGGTTITRRESLSGKWSNRTGLAWVS